MLRDARTLLYQTGTFDLFTGFGEIMFWFVNYVFSGFVAGTRRLFYFLRLLVFTSSR